MPGSGAPRAPGARQQGAATPYEVPRYGLYGTSTTFELQAAMAELTRLGAELVDLHNIKDVPLKRAIS